MDFKTNKLSNQNLKLTGRTQQQKGKKKQNVLTQRQINTNHPIGQEKKKTAKNEQSFRELQDDNKRYNNIYVNRVPEREVKLKKISEEIMTENFPNWTKDTNLDSKMGE